MTFTLAGCSPKILHNLKACNILQLVNIILYIIDVYRCTYLISLHHMYMCVYKLYIHKIYIDVYICIYISIYIYIHSWCVTVFSDMLIAESVYVGVCPTYIRLINIG